VTQSHVTPVIHHKWEDSYIQQGIDGLLKFYQLQCNFAIQEVFFFFQEYGRI